MKHHKYSPSKLDRIAACPGSVAASARVRKGLSDEDWDNHTGSEAATEGTMLHAIMAGTLEPTDLTAEQEELIEKAREYIAMHFDNGGEVMREKQVVLMDEDFTVVTEGMADVVCLYDELAKMVDFKFGRKWVRPDGLQMKAYSAAVMQTFGVDCVESHIYQPRAGDGKPTLFTNFDELFQEVKAVIDAAKNPQAPLVPGDHCGFCPARLDCTACANLENAVMCREETLLACPERLGLAAKYAVTVRKRCEQIEAANKAATIAGKPTGWKIIERAGRPAITDAKVALDRVQSIVPYEEYISMVSVPFGVLRDAVAAKLKVLDDLPAKKSEERLIEMLGDSFTRGTAAQVCIVDKQKGGLEK